jgi:hypothetical protein
MVQAAPLVGLRCPTGGEHFQRALCQCGVAVDRIVDLVERLVETAEVVELRRKRTRRFGAWCLAQV